VVERVAEKNTHKNQIRQEFFIVPRETRLSRLMREGLHSFHQERRRKLEGKEGNEPERLEGMREEDENGMCENISRCPCLSWCVM